MTLHFYNSLIEHNRVPFPYQICSYNYSLIQLFICTQFCTFSLSNLPLAQFTHTRFYLHSILYLLPIKFDPMTFHFYNSLIEHYLVPFPYQICPCNYSLIQFFICTQFCTFSLSNLPLAQFTHTRFYLHSILYPLPIKFAPMTIHSYNILLALNFVPFPYQICPYDSLLLQLFICTKFCTFSLSNLPLSQFTHTKFYLQTILLHFPNHICSYNYLLIQCFIFTQFVPSPYQICKNQNSLLQQFICTQFYTFSL